MPIASGPQQHGAPRGGGGRPRSWTPDGQRRECLSCGVHTYETALCFNCGGLTHPLGARTAHMAAHAGLSTGPAGQRGGQQVSLEKESRVAGLVATGSETS